jgi:hypothetical protein
MDDHGTYRAAIAADNAWHAELVRQFGSKHAIEARYKAACGDAFRGNCDGRGAVGSELRRLYEEYITARDTHFNR